MDHKTTNVDEILKERGATYGSYGAGVECRARILNALNEKHIETQGTDLPEGLRIMFGDVALKLMRIASDPTHQDSYIDLAGYSKIIKEYVVDLPLKKVQNNAGLTKGVTSGTKSYVDAKDGIIPPQPITTALSATAVNRVR